MSEVTLQCVSAHHLVEHTSVLSFDEVRAGHAQRLRDFRHVRYMWIPYANACVVITCNEVSAEEADTVKAALAATPGQANREAALAPLRQVLIDVCQQHGRPLPPNLASASMTALRDLILAVSPLELDTVTRINKVPQCLRW